MNETRRERSAALENVLCRLRGVKRQSRGVMALCPCPNHNDTVQSLSVCEKGGKILLKCFGGCPQQDIVEAIGLSMADLFVDSRQRERDEFPIPIRINDLALDKQLPAAFLVTLGIKNNSHGVEISYRLMDGSRAPRQRIRTALVAKKGSRWDSAQGTIVPYGLWKLTEARAAGFLIVVEGESDSWTLWHHGFPALGIPGTTMVSCLQLEHIAGIPKLFVVREPDAGGSAFVPGISKRLAEIGWRGEVSVVSLDGAKDPNELHKASSQHFKAKFESALDSARILKLENTKGLVLTRLSDLLGEPDEPVTYVLADKLPAGGLSVIAAKPKVGKSTFVRCLAIAVARGEPFLGCPTMQGPVFYLALEEKRSEVRDHFRKLGATGEEPILIYAASAPQDALPQLCDLVEQQKPVLVIIDPLFKFVRVRDEKAYAEVCAAIEPLLTLARESGAHVLLTHHNGKADKIDATDAILGSTAIFGGVDTAVILKKYERYRTLQSCQRYGADWSELVLEFNSEDKSLSLGAERAEAERDRIADAILIFLSRCVEPQTREQIENSVEGKTKHKRTAIRALAEVGRIVESGAGTKGSPFRYELSLPNPVMSELPEAPRAVAARQDELVSSCSLHMQGSREQESMREGEGDSSTEDKVVPGFDPSQAQRAESWEQESPTSEDEAATKSETKVLVSAEVPSPQPRMRRQAGFLEGDL